MHGRFYPAKSFSGQFYPCLSYYLIWFTSKERLKFPFILTHWIFYFLRPPYPSAGKRSSPIFLSLLFSAKPIFDPR